MSTTIGIKVHLVRPVGQLIMSLSGSRFDRAWAEHFINFFILIYIVGGQRRNLLIWLEKEATIVLKWLIILYLFQGWVDFRLHKFEWRSGNLSKWFLLDQFQEWRFWVDFFLILLILSSVAIFKNAHCIQIIVWIYWTLRSLTPRF